VFKNGFGRLGKYKKERGLKDPPTLQAPSKLKPEYSIFLKKIKQYRELWF
jgi:hypothetical protein